MSPGKLPPLKTRQGLWALFNFLASCWTFPASIWKVTALCVLDATPSTTCVNFDLGLESFLLAMTSSHTLEKKQVGTLCWNNNEQWSLVEPRTLLEVIGLHTQAISHGDMAFLACQCTASTRPPSLLPFMSDCQRHNAKTRWPPLVRTQDSSMHPSNPGLELLAPSSLSSTDTGSLSIATNTAPAVCSWVTDVGWVANLWIQCSDDTEPRRTSNHTF